MWDELGEVVVQGVFIALLNGKLDAGIGPEALESVHTVRRHGLVGADFRVCSDDLCKSLDTGSANQRAGR